MKKLYIVGIGPGDKDNMTLLARKALKNSTIICGYTKYIDLIAPLFPKKEFFSSGMTKEKQRVLFALSQAQKGKTTSLVSSGDSCIYALAGLSLDLAKDIDIDIEIVPGVTACVAASCVAGAVLSNDFAVVSLSNILTPQQKIDKRLIACGEGDFVVAIYNPCSKSRPTSLGHALDILKKTRRPDTPCAYVRSLGTKEGKCIICTFEELQTKQLPNIDMLCTVFIGNSDTKIIQRNGKKLLITDRGYDISK